MSILKEKILATLTLVSLVLSAVSLFMVFKQQRQIKLLQISLWSISDTMQRFITK